MTQSICSSSQDQSSSPRSLIPPRKSATNFHRRRGRSVFSMLVQREMSPNAKFVPRKRWGKSRWYTDSSCGTNSEPLREAGQSLTSWVEAESLQHLSAKYCPLGAPPRSTIAAAFSSDGRTLASTHGDHTVKIIDCETGNCLKVLNGHQRTPWVVRFHPLHSEIVASGSLDLEVRLWNITTSECIRSHVFYRPIASIAFHAEGELLAVASGHKLHMWHYNRRGDESSPTVVLKTRRSLRAVHFHPHGAPFLLTAEVNEIDSLDSSMSRATSMGYLRYPPPAILFTSTESNRTSLAAENENRTSSLPFPLATSSGPFVSNSVPGNSPSNILFTRAGDRTPAVDGMNVDEAQPVGRNGIPSQVSTRSDFPELGQIRQLYHFRDRVSWELPFLQGWLMAQGHGVSNPVVPPTGSSNHGIAAPSSTASLEAAVALLEIPSGVNLHAVSGRGRAQEQTSQPQFSGSGLPEGVSSHNTQHGSDAQPVVNRVQSELATSIAASAAAAAASAELPCTVKLRVWSHDIKDPYAQLKSDRCLFTIPHAVLCSEMGAHFSPCGRYLAACVACVFPHAEIDPGLQTQAQQDSGLATSPTRHPVTAHQVIYELRVYSLQKESFGSVLVSRAIRAAHCLTSIQFSPTSEHILLAYGRRHGSLLRSIVSDGEATSHFFTVLEIYRVSDMELVRVLPSSDDEVNVACFHPSPGGGLVYGTKEGKLRIFQYNTAATSNFTGPNT
ncbi:transducin family protein [Arabidopsis lyrata subsp. lyrata]|uniref:Transducin family protein n=1 Tax=Arabidopsis lyrata subsp. lyrata TaxID=81972 RepID=D7MNJ5_ARALL|nr:transducin family protein [Arabidopsis lyrata subsp. lyrata]